jgi:hypothetical protein
MYKSTVGPVAKKNTRTQYMKSRPPPLQRLHRLSRRPWDAVFPHFMHLFCITPLDDIMEWVQGKHLQEWAQATQLSPANQAAFQTSQSNIGLFNI